MSSFVKESEQTASGLLARFMDANALARQPDQERMLGNLARAYAALPYENLTKIIRESQTSSREEARRLPREVLDEHWTLGTGGTCFSLTWTLLQLARALGVPAEPILADRRYGADTHCALVVYFDGQAHLLDPGYLLVDPVPLPQQGDLLVSTPFNQLSLRPREGSGRVDLTTVDANKTAHRLTYKIHPVDTGQFLKAWDASFDWEMMTYPVLSRIDGNRQLYWQKDYFVIRGKEGAQRIELAGADANRMMAEQFGLTPAVVDQALAILQRRGERP